MSDLFKAAQFYHDRGLSILPCRLFFDEKNKCKKPPLIKEWATLQKKQVSKIELMKWKSLFNGGGKGKGVGIITGKVSNLLVVDIDSEEAMECIRTLLEPVRTVVVKTPGGWHYYFKHRDGFGNNVGIDPSSGLDIRSEGGYVCAPPSQYPDGRPYQYLQGGKFVDHSSVSPMPEDLFEHLQKLLVEKKRSPNKSGSGGKSSKSGWFHELMLNGVGRGGRTAAMVSAEGWMLSQKIPHEAIKTFITLFNRTLGDDALTDHELMQEVFPAIERLASDMEDNVTKNLNQKISLVELESGERVISEKYEDHKGVRKIRFSKPAQVRESYIEKEIMVGKKPQCVYDVWRTHKDKKKHRGVIFDPSAEPWESGEFINLWKGFRLTPKEGDWSLYRDHIKNIINKDHWEWILQWMARIVQDPGGKRPGTVLVLRGDQGTGKGVFANVFGSLLGKMEYYFAVNKISDLTGKFNEDLKTALLLFIDEATWGGDRESAGVLKSLITEPTRRIEPKGINAFHVDNYLNLIIASNNRWVVPGGANERRFFVMDVSNERQQDTTYFKAILDQMYGNGKAGIRAMYYDLLKTKVDHDLIAHIPKTEATGDQITQGMETEELFWFERLTIGTLVDRHDHWKYLSVNETLYQQYLEYCKSRNKQAYALGRQQWGAFLHRMCPDVAKKRGYDKEKGVRYTCRVFPSLDRCRQIFSKKFGLVIEWPEALEPDGITERIRNTDEPGPHYKNEY
jgi:hypothetical protein